MYKTVLCDKYLWLQLVVGREKEKPVYSYFMFVCSVSVSNLILLVLDMQKCMESKYTKEVDSEPYGFEHVYTFWLQECYKMYRRVQNTFLKE